jgi:hypothetical protein
MFVGNPEDMSPEEIRKQNAIEPVGSDEAWLAAVMGAMRGAKALAGLASEMRGGATASQILASRRPTLPDIKTTVQEAESPAPGGVDAWLSRLADPTARGEVEDRRRERRRHERAQGETGTPLFFGDAGAMAWDDDRRRRLLGERLPGAEPLPSPDLDQGGAEDHDRVLAENTTELRRLNDWLMRLGPLGTLGPAPVAVGLAPGRPGGGFPGLAGGGGGGAQGGLAGAFPAGAGAPTGGTGAFPGGLAPSLAGGLLGDLVGGPGALAGGFPGVPGGFGMAGMPGAGGTGAFAGGPAALIAGALSGARRAFAGGLGGLLRGGGGLGGIGRMFGGGGTLSRMFGGFGGFGGLGGRGLGGAGGVIGLPGFPGGGAGPIRIPGFSGAAGPIRIPSLPGVGGAGGGAEPLAPGAPPGGGGGDFVSVPGAAAGRGRQHFSAAVDAGISQAARGAGVSPNMLRAIADIESSGNPNAVTGSYRGLFQIGADEWRKYGGRGSIFDVNENARVAAEKIRDENIQLSKKLGRPITEAEGYLAHQQGVAGAFEHLAHPDRAAWESIAATAEGRQKGAGWAKRAIWGNIPNAQKAGFGSVENVTSGQFADLWRQRYARATGFASTQMATARTGAPSAVAEGEGPSLQATAGRRPNLAQVDPRLRDIIAKAGEGLPEGYRATVNEGYNPAGHVAQSQHHIAGSGALDMLITGPHGPISNRGEDPTGMYTALARNAYAVMLRDHPELEGKLAWGGRFGTVSGGGTPDLMHFDLGGDRGHFRPSLRQMFAGAQAPDRGSLNRAALTGNGTMTHKVEGTGSLSVNVNAPPGTSVAAEGGGLFKKVEMTRQTQMAPAQGGPQTPAGTAFGPPS